jgi:hypothetical protein
MANAANDSYKPCFFRVAIVAAGLQSAPPSDGFIDPTTTFKYCEVVTLDGTANPTLNAGDTVMINQIAVTFPTASPTAAQASVIINALTDQHHVVASDDGSGDIELTNETLFEGDPITVTEVTVGALSRMGYVHPTVIAPPSNVDNIADATAKARANYRWSTLMKILNSEATTYTVNSVVKTGGTVDAAPTEIDFTVAYASAGFVATYDELNPGQLLYEVQAVQRWVARALMVDYTTVLEIENPTVDIEWNFIIGPQMLTTQVGNLATSIANANASITVTPINFVR